MPIADYAHWNEDAEFMWWHEEGKHVEEAPDVCEPDDRWDDGEVFHDSQDDCIAGGNFNRKYGSVVWYCADCGENMPLGFNP